MADLNYLLIREKSIPVPGAETYTPGIMYANGLRFCETCEDEDRFLEKGGVKVYGRTAIPRGKYRVTVSFSNHFGKELPEILGVRTHSGVRFHGGNKAEDSEGCVLTGQVRTSTGIAQCKETVQKMIERIKETEARGEFAYVEIK